MPFPEPPVCSGRFCTLSTTCLHKGSPFQAWFCTSRLIRESSPCTCENPSNIWFFACVGLVSTSHQAQGAPRSGQLATSPQPNPQESSVQVITPLPFILWSTAVNSISLKYTRPSGSLTSLPGSAERPPGMTWVLSLKHERSLQGGRLSLEHWLPKAARGKDSLILKESVEISGEARPV